MDIIIFLIGAIIGMVLTYLWIISETDGSLIVIDGKEEDNEVRTYMYLELKSPDLKLVRKKRYVHFKVAKPRK